ncbi:aminotransferase class V-fold PLP-dependent enzyme [Salinispora vitiensis]|uniref:aminotransferase class V-fold PLP-dependent enzyme n=1 Tax=Salinispora vitiensis TaxID=999544 RepID=UPI000379FDF3|nr:aminotransferase class V-fold PLP-dependent enzyme [Salinispora vitiensis]
MTRRGVDAFGPARDEFAGLDWTHLAWCSHAPRATRVQAALLAMTAAMDGPTSAWETWEPQIGLLRDRFADLIGCRGDQVALLADASTAAFQVASTLPWSPRPKIVMSSAEFPGLAHVWLAQQARGAEVVIVGDQAGRVSGEDYLQAVDERTALVSIPAVTYRDGVRLPIREITDAAHAAGAMVVVDGYQALGVEPVDVARWDCDYLIAGFSKYALGLPGVVGLYERTVGERRPDLTGWQGRSALHRWDSRQLDWPQRAARFQAGTPAVPAVYAATAGLSLINELDLQAVRQHVTMLLGDAHRQLSAAGWSIATPQAPEEHGAHLAVRHPEPEKLTAWLADQQVAVSPRGGVVRIAVHAYSTPAEVSAACDLLARFNADHPGQNALVGTS